MPKPGTNKERCKRYEASGHREANKARRQERARKRAERFAKRRAEGKGYEYKPNPYDPVRQQNKYTQEARARSEKNANHNDEISNWRSVMRKLNNEMSQKEEEEKRIALKSAKKES